MANSLRRPGYAIQGTKRTGYESGTYASQHTIQLARGKYIERKKRLRFAAEARSLVTDDRLKM